MQKNTNKDKSILVELRRRLPLRGRCPRLCYFGKHILNKKNGCFLIVRTKLKARDVMQDGKK